MIDKIKVNVICDPNNSTWNIMDANKNCLSYGTAEDADAWLFEHRETHEEAL